MTKKHFIALADMVKFDNSFTQGIAWDSVQINRLADFCEAVNPRFNRERWLAYIKGECGKNGGKVKQTV